MVITLEYRSQSRNPSASASLMGIMTAGVDMPVERKEEVLGQLMVSGQGMVHKGVNVEDLRGNTWMFLG